MLLNMEILKQIRSQCRKSNKIVVFTNGCFDILHSGHVVYLEAAKRMGDILIIGLNTDSSVSRLKGKNRPVNSQEDRATVLSALRTVDFVCLFDEETPYELIKELQPDILVKGGDYKTEEIVGYDIVKAAGGIVCTVPVVVGKSTTSIINKLNGFIFLAL